MHRGPRFFLHRSGELSPRLSTGQERWFKVNAPIRVYPEVEEENKTRLFPVRSRTPKERTHGRTGGYYRFFFGADPGATFGRNVRDGQRSLSRSGSVLPLIWQSPSVSLVGE
jgi:hypothetical protein